MWTPKIEIVDANLPSRARQDSRRGAIGWSGVLASVGFALVGHVRELSDLTVVAVSGTLLAVSLVLINWARLWIRESEEPFQYTFSVGSFEQRSNLPGSGAAETDELLSWLARDLTASLSTRVQRLSLLAEPPAGGDGVDRAASHVHISGWYGIRRVAEGDQHASSRRWQLEIVSKVRLGGAEAPAKLGQTVHYDLGKGSGGWAGIADMPPTLAQNQYDAAFERLYWSVASQIYAQIGRGVADKVNLLPPGRLRAAAYLHEADDYATSNTLDAYDAARELYEAARELYDVESREEPATRWRRGVHRARIRIDRIGRRLRRRLARVVRRAARREVLTARAELGQARMLTAEWHLKLLCGTVPQEIFKVIPLTKRAIGRLEKLPPDVEESQETLFRGQLTLAMARFLLRDQAGAEQCLAAARRSNPMGARKDAEFLFISGANEPARLRSLRLLREAVELDPTMELAHFYRAVRCDDVWRSQKTFEPDVALMVDEEYRAVIALDPGNIAAWANRGYVAWLLAEGEREEVWRDRALAALEAGRQYKEVRQEAVVAELDWNLARLAAEAGEIPRAYGHYIEAVSAQLGDSPFKFSDYFYENAGDALVKRFVRYRRQVFRRAKGCAKSERRLADSVKAFVLNDCGLAYQFYHARSGEEEALDQAMEAFSEAIELNESFVLPVFNLAKLHRQIWATGSASEENEDEVHLVEAAELLADVLRREPDWTPAQLLMVDVQAQLGARLAEKRSQLKEGADLTLPAPLLPDLLDSEEPEPGSARRAEIARLKQQRNECHQKLEEQLRRLLPHACFSRNSSNSRSNGQQPHADLGHRIDALGTHVHSLTQERDIEWMEDFSELHVAALIEWAKALAADPSSAQAAFELCAMLREVYYWADQDLLGAHRAAARMRLNQVPAGAAQAKRLGGALKECEDLVNDGIRRILTDDPGHYSVLSTITFERFTRNERREMLLNARSANPSPATLLSVGDQLADMDERDQACEVFENAAEEEKGPVTPSALLRLGAVRVEIGDTAAGIDAYRQAALSGSTLVAPDAAFRAGDLLTTEGKPAAALGLYKEVAKASPDAAIALGRLLEADPQGADPAIAVYRTVLAPKPVDPQAAPAGLHLARLLDPASQEAEKALRIALEAAEEETRANAQIGLAQTLLDRPVPDPKEAEALLRGALDSSLALARSQAAVLLARMLQGRGERKEAEQLYRQAIAEGDPSTTTTAALELGAIFEESREHDAARDVYRQAAKVHSWTALTLARGLKERDDAVTAEELCRIGADPEGPDPLFAPDSLLLLGELLAARGDLDEAEKTYWKVIETDDVTVTPAAAVKLGELFERKGKSPIRAYEQAIRRVDGFHAFAVASALGAKLRAQDERDSAMVVYLTAAMRDPWAALQVGDELGEQGEAVVAEQAYRFAAESESIYRNLALLRIAGLLAKSDRDQAKEIYGSVIASGDPDAATTAEKELAALH